MLEKAVKWVIILLLLVLDPFAILLVMAATDRYRLHKGDLAILQYGDADHQGELIEQLKEQLKAAVKEKDSIFRIMGDRNKEMNELREETQRIIDDANEEVNELKELAELYP